MLDAFSQSLSAVAELLVKTVTLAGLSQRTNLQNFKTIRTNAAELLTIKQIFTSVLGVTIKRHKCFEKGANRSVPIGENIVWSSLQSG